MRAIRYTNHDITVSFNHKPFQVKGSLGLEAEIVDNTTRSVTVIDVYETSPLFNAYQIFLLFEHNEVFYERIQDIWWFKIPTLFKSLVSKLTRAKYIR